MVASSSAALARTLCDDADAVAAVAWFKGAMLAALRPPEGERLSLSDWRALLRYLHADMGFATSERLRALFLDARNGLIADEVVALGSTLLIGVP